MRKKIYKFVSIALGFMLFGGSLLLAGEKAEGNLARRIDLAGLSGVMLWIAQIYNDQRWLFAIVCTVTMALLGIFIAIITDVLLKMLGLQVSKIVHHE